jgi:hypothetical protein
MRGHGLTGVGEDKGGEILVPSRAAPVPILWNAHSAPEFGFRRHAGIRVGVSSLSPRYTGTAGKGGGASDGACHPRGVVQPDGEEIVSGSVRVPSKQRDSFLGQPLRWVFLLPG